MPLPFILAGGVAIFGFWKSYHQAPPVKLSFTVFGPRGVGKTSLLAGMYKNLSDRVGKISREKIELIAEEKTKLSLEACFNQLRQVVTETKHRVNKGVDGTVDSREFRFYMQYKNASPFLETCFYDFPGGWLESNANEENSQKVQNLCKMSDVILIAIDSPPMMEKAGRYNSSVNREFQVSEALEKALNTAEKKLICFVPLRCESYIHTQKERLFKRVQEVYKDIFHICQKKMAANSVALVVAPCETTGNFFFSNMTVNEKGVIEQITFRKDSLREFAPRNCDLVILGVLAFLIKLYSRKDRWIPGTNWIRNMTNWDRELLNFVKQISRELDTDSFKIFHGRELLWEDK